MGRAERRRTERRNRIQNRKGKYLLSKADINQIKQKKSDDVSAYNVEALMTCFALAERRLYGFGKKRIFRTLQYIDDLMGTVLTDEATIEDYKKELQQEARVVIKC